MPAVPAIPEARQLKINIAYKNFNLGFYICQCFFIKPKIITKTRLANVKTKLLNKFNKNKIYTKGLH